MPVSRWRRNAVLCPELIGTSVELTPSVAPGAVDGCMDGCNSPLIRLHKKDMQSNMSKATESSLQNSLPS